MPIYQRHQIIFRILFEVHSMKGAKEKIAEKINVYQRFTHRFNKHYVQKYIQHKRRIFFKTYDYYYEYHINLQQQRYDLINALHFN